MKTSAMFSILILAGIAPLVISDAYAQPTLFGAAHTGGPGSPSTFYSIDSSTGTANPIGPIGFARCSGMDVHPFSLVMYAVCEDDNFDEVLITINTSTGAGTAIGLTGGFHQDISFRNSDGTLFGFSSGQITTINLATGQANFLAGPGIFGSGNGLGFSLADVLFHSDESDLNTLSDGNGNLLTSTPHGYPGNLNDPRNNALDFHPGTSVLFASTNDGFSGQGPNYLSTVDTNSAVVTVRGQTVNGLDAIAFLPEPKTVGGEILSINSSALLLAGIQISAAWILPVILSVAGIGYVYLRRK